MVLPRLLTENLVREVVFFTVPRIRYHTIWHVVARIRIQCTHWMPRGRGQARAGARRSARGDTDACSEDELGGSAAPSSAKRAGVALAGRPDSRKRMRGRGQDSADAGDAAAQMIAAAARHVPAPAAGLHTRGDGMDTANEGGDSTADAQGTGRLETEGL